MKGIVTSKRAAEILSFLREVGPSPEEALIIAFGPKAKKALEHLRKAGYAELVRRNGIEFWTADKRAFDAQEQLVISWFSARLIEAGGRVIDKVAVFPKGQAFEIEVVEDKIFTGPYVFFLSDLLSNSLPQCVRRV